MDRHEVKYMIYAKIITTVGSRFAVTIACLFPLDPAVAFILQSFFPIKILKARRQLEWHGTKGSDP